VAALLGCADAPVTESSTYKSPLSKGREFRKVAVWTKAGLSARKQTEGWAVAELRKNRIDAVASLDIWPIDAPREEIQTKLKANGIGAVLVLALDTVSRTSTYTTTATTLFGDTPDIATEQTSKTNKLNVVFSATLFNNATGRVAWQSQASTSANASSWNDINASFVQKTVEDLAAAQIMYLCLPKYAPPPELGPPPGPDASDAMKKRYTARAAELQKYQVPVVSPEDCPPESTPKAQSI
jgi:hypothetical protein